MTDFSQNVTNFSTKNVTGLSNARSIQIILANISDIFEETVSVCHTLIERAETHVTDEILELSKIYRLKFTVLFTALAVNKTVNKAFSELRCAELVGKGEEKTKPPTTTTTSTAKPPATTTKSKAQPPASMTNSTTALPTTTINPPTNATINSTTN